jgi:hypothetical protein
MILVGTKSKKKYWVEDYTSEKDFLTLNRRLKNGSSQKILVPKHEVAEIVFLDVSKIKK